MSEVEDLASASSSPAVSKAEAQLVDSASYQDSTADLERDQHDVPNATAAAEMDLSLVADPILELCPSLEILQQIVHSSAVDLETKKAKLGRALLRAASNGDTDMLSWLLDRKAEARPILASRSKRTDSRGRSDIAFEELRDEEGSGPVVLASCAGHIDAVTVLVLNGAEVDERDACGWTPLMWAINSSNLPLASFLLSRGADVDAKSTKGTTCEDFILSAAPEAATSMPSGLGLDGFKDSSKPASDEQEAIADLIYEHQRYISVQQSAAQRLNNLFLDNSPDRPKPTCSDSGRQSVNASPTRSNRASLSSSASPSKPVIRDPARSSHSEGS